MSLAPEYTLQGMTAVKQSVALQVHALGLCSQLQHCLTLHRITSFHYGLRCCYLS